MTAPMFHLAPGSLKAAEPGSVLVLEGPEGHHAATVMRLGVNEQVQLSDTEHTRAHAVVTAVEGGRLELQISGVDTEDPPLPRLVLVQALAKDRRDLQAIESATELGVDAVIPWQAERSVARWKAGREAKKHAEWVNTVTTAAKQTRRTSIPTVHPLHTTAQYLTAPAAGEGVGVVVLHETKEVSLHTVLTQMGVLTEMGALEHEPAMSEIHVVVGPEGGISDRELQRLTAAGARTARLGAHVLRSSTAGPAAIAGLQLLLGRWHWT